MSKPTEDSPASSSVGEKSPMVNVDKNNQSSASGLNNPEPISNATWKTLETQVGGHQFAHGEYGHQKLGMVDLCNGLVLKSLQNPPRGPREASFYEKVFDPKCDDCDLLELRPFLPPFCGIEERGKAKFLKLGNLTCGFQNPCVMDLKMGRVTYDQEATPEKIEHEISKYPPLKNLGFQITGMMRYDPETQSKEQFGKPYCRELTEENMCKDGLGRFFGLHNNDLRKDAIHPVLCKLKRLESWFLKQRKFSFVASSLLITYEGAKIALNKQKLSEEMRNCSDGDYNGNVSTQAGSGAGDTEDTRTASASQDPSHKSVDTNNSGDVRAQKRLSQGDAGSLGETVKKARLSDQKDSSTLSKEGSQSRNSVPPVVSDVHLIDFAHAFPTTDVDHNFLFGLQKVISFLQELLE